QHLAREDADRWQARDHPERDERKARGDDAADAELLLILDDAAMPAEIRGDHQHDEAGDDLDRVDRIRVGIHGGSPPTRSTACANCASCAHAAIVFECAIASAAASISSSYLASASR